MTNACVCLPLLEKLSVINRAWKMPYSQHGTFQLSSATLSLLFLYHCDSCLKVPKLTVTGDQGSDAESSKEDKPQSVSCSGQGTRLPLLWWYIARKSMSTAKKKKKKDEIVDQLLIKKTSCSEWVRNKFSCIANSFFEEGLHKERYTLIYTCIQVWGECAETVLNVAMGLKELQQLERFSQQVKGLNVAKFIWEDTGTGEVCRLLYANLCQLWGCWLLRAGSARSRGWCDTGSSTSTGCCPSQGCILSCCLSLRTKLNGAGCSI